MSREGKLIKEARERRGLTLTDVAELAGTSASALSGLENGQRKSAPSPDEMVVFSDLLDDREMLVKYCTGCKIRSRVKVRKFAPLNKIVGGALGANYKLTEKLAAMAEKAPAMMSGIINPKFKQDPESERFLDRYILLMFDLMRVAEGSVDKLVEEGFITEERVHMLKQINQLNCEERGYHDESEG